MNRAAKITTAASALVVAGLVALAVPAFSTIGTVASGVKTTAASFTPTPEFTPTPAASPEASRTLTDQVAAIPDADGAPRYCDTGYTPPVGATPYDQGPRERAEGEVEVVDGVPTSYVVASNDYLPSIGARFCLDYSAIAGMSDLPTNRDIWPGDVLTLRP